MSSASTYNTRSKKQDEDKQQQHESSIILETHEMPFILEFKEFKKRCEEEIDSLKSQVNALKSENKKLKSRIHTLEEESDESYENSIEIEKDVIELQQYIRRNNIEIAGIPDEIPQEQLEKKVLEIAETLNIPLKATDIEACHRLPNNKNSKPKNTIIRFVNRKTAEKFLRKRKINKTLTEKINLNKHDIYINPNLCPYNRVIMGKIVNLHKNDLIYKYWIFNGNINIMLKEGQSPIKIKHLDQLTEIIRNL